MKYLHTMIRISNIEKSLEFFCKGLGLKETRRMENEKGRYTLIFLAAPNDESAEIELTYNWDGDNLMGTIEVLDTPKGQILEKLINRDIKLGISSKFTDIQDDIATDLNTAKIKIIETKLLLLFGLITEEQMTEGFTNLKTTYKTLIDAENTVKKELSEQQLVLQSEMMPGTAVAVEDERKVQRKTLAKANEIALGGFISNFKSLIKEYEADESADTKLAKMTDAIDLYLQNILPTITIIRKLLYSVNTVVQEKKQYKLVQLRSSLREQVFDVEKPEIISNKK